MWISTEQNGGQGTILNRDCMRYSLGNCDRRGDGQGAEMQGHGATEGLKRGASERDWGPLGSDARVKIFDRDRARERVGCRWTWRAG